MTDLISDPHFLKHIEPKFWYKVDIARIDECWLWTGAKTDNGYGRYYYTESKSIRAHRLAYILTHGPIPEGMEVCHWCDNPLCCNPAHLWLGTHQDNMTDMVTKGRLHGLKGERANLAKLTTEQVKQIRQMYTTGQYSHANLGHIFKVSESTIQKIITRSIWAHV